MKKKLKNVILKTITFIMAVLFIIGAGGMNMESESVIIPTLITLVSGTWLFLFYMVNVED